MGPQNHEGAPLLGGPSSRSPSPSPSLQPAAPSPTTHSVKHVHAARWQASNPKTIIALLALVKFSAVSSGLLIIVPLYRLIEDAICHAELGDPSDGLIDEMKCKIDAVQSRLAFTIGYLQALSAVATFAVAFPYGLVADRIGRKPTALLSYTGIALSFAFGPFTIAYFQQRVRQNPYILMGGAVLLLLGGGVQIFLATLYAMAADVSSESEKAASFLYLTFGATAGGLVGPLLAGFLMNLYGPWVPIFVVLCVTPFVFGIFIFIPETLTEEIKTDHNHSKGVSAKETVAKAFKDLYHSLGILKNTNVPLILMTFLVQNARIIAYTSFLSQYVSKHFGWRLADTAFLLSPLGLLNMVVLVLLPKISDIMLSPRFGFTIFGKDLRLTQVSTLLIIAGAVIEGFSDHVVLFILGLFIGTFGAADSPLARATVSHYVEPEFTSRLYALIGMVEIIGSVLGGPVLAALFDWGLRAKGLWTGLPWLYIAVLHFVAWVCLRLVKPPANEGTVSDDEGRVHSD